MRPSSSWEDTFGGPGQTSADPPFIKSEPPEHEQDVQQSSEEPRPSLSSSSRTSSSQIDQLRDAIHVRYLFQNFIICSSGGTSSGWLAYLLPRLYASAKTDSTLNLAVRAAAWAYIGNKRRDRDLQLEAREFYGRSLSALSADVMNPEIATSNSTLVAVLILGLFECIAGRNEQSFWHSHGQGLRTLLHLRITYPSPDMQDIPPSELPDGIILCQLQRQDLDLRQPPSVTERVFIESLDKTKPTIRMFSASFECNHVVARAHDTLTKFNGTVAGFERLEQVVTDIQNFDSQLNGLFSSSLAPHDLTENRGTMILSDAEIQIIWTESNPTYRAFAMWIFLKASRMILHEVHLQCLETLQASGNAYLHSLNVIRDICEAIFSAADYMGCQKGSPRQDTDDRGPKHIGGYYLLWPLRVVLDSQYTNEVEKKAAKDILLSIGEEMYLTQAFEIARRGEMEPIE